MASNWAASALGWWEEAGVDTIVGEEPRDWLAPKAKAADVPPPAPPPDALPDTIEGFHAWLAATDQLPYAAPGAGRAEPAGDPAAGLMILTDMPSPDGGLISGEAGALFDKMLGAIGLSRETIYLAALSPMRTPTGTIGEAEAARLAEIARHHIGLAAPKALLLFGDACGKAWWDRRWPAPAPAGTTSRPRPGRSGRCHLSDRKAADPAEAQVAGLGRPAEAREELAP